MKELKVKYLDDSIEKKMSLPRSGDVGIDLYSAEDIHISKGEVALVSLGIAVEIPAGFWLYIRDRSSISKYCQISAGIIDSSYRGALKVRMFCHTGRDTVEEVRRVDPCDLPYSMRPIGPKIEYVDKTFHIPGFKIQRGDKIAQMILCKDYNSEFNLIEVPTLSDTERGSGGFGSTGKK
ncbi:MAG: hypothetical protein DRQ40_04710 [Gammaproteobacteria bacterium]|nr:MAG: hypothetical protein DRQ40_04710 [Gammaproteobacteria bacterium]